MEAAAEGIEDLSGDIADKVCEMKHHRTTAANLEPLLQIDYAIVTVGHILTVDVNSRTARLIDLRYFTSPDHHKR